MPLLTLCIGLKTATPLFALIGVTNSAIIAIRHWRRVDFSTTGRLIVATWAGIPTGALLIKYLPGGVVTSCLGWGLIGFGVYRLANLQLPRLQRSLWALPFGFCAGVLGGAYNTSGPPIVVYGEMKRWPPMEFRANLQSYFFPTALGVAISHGLAGLWTPAIFTLYGLSLPGTLIAIAIGSVINQKLTVERFQRLLSLILLLLGILLLL